MHNRQTVRHARVADPAGSGPFTFSGVLKAVSERLSGISLEVALSCAGRTFRENALFTHLGLSGPAALQLSSYWRTGECVEMDVLPGIDAAPWLASQKRDHPRSLLRNLLAQCLPKRLVLELQAIFWQPRADQPIGGLPDAVLHQASEGLSRWRLKPSGTEGYRTAEVTLGGVDTGELSSKTMESRTRPGLYSIGEVVDVGGIWADSICSGRGRRGLLPDSLYERRDAPACHMRLNLLRSGAQSGECHHH